MKGLMLARRYYEKIGAKMLTESFPDFADRIACGFVGEGSECFGFDDAFSQDHDFGAGFCLWLTDEDFDKIGAELEEAYDALPHEFMGYQKRSQYANDAQRIGVMRTSSFYRKYIGSAKSSLSLEEWRRIPEEFLAVATNGEVFRDDCGEFTAIRKMLCTYYPEDIRLKKLAVRVAVMAQAGQYNYLRCIDRKETVAALCALGRFIEAACSAVYLLNRKYKPFYKWAHRGMKDFPILCEAYQDLSLIGNKSADYKAIAATIEKICAEVSIELRKQDLSDSTADFLIGHAKSITEKIQDPLIRKLHIMAE